MNQIPITASRMVSEIAGQNITIRPAARLNRPTRARSPRPGPAPAAATVRSTTPCSTQNTPTMNASRITVTDMWRRQYSPASAASNPMIT